MSSITIPNSSRSAGRSAIPMTEPARALLAGPDEPLLGLITEWLEEHGCSVQVERDHGLRPGRYDFIVADVPFPRGDGATLLRRLESRHPGTPILLLSSTFFAG